MKEYFDYWNQYQQDCCKFYEQDWKVPYFHNDGTTIKEVDFCNHNNQVQ
jgi:hypothetical protein